MTINYDAARIALNDERAKLVHQLEELGATESGDLRSDVEFGDSFADAGAATAERTEVIGLIESLKRQLDSVDGALVKLDDGQYGLCVTCGKPIGAARMEARPTSVRCMDCKSRKL
ncbi:MAG: TraR/DksA C4-type zinc finger protein [Acidimicrobiia bacterium]|nr:TraR/DksA C4-type zinc finger protein [Acidimicrobiia bacterium]